MLPCFEELQEVCRFRRSMLDSSSDFIFVPNTCVGSEVHHECCQDRCQIWSRWACAVGGEAEDAVERLADWLMLEHPGEVTGGEDAVTMAIRLLRNYAMVLSALSETEKGEKDVEAEA